MPRQLLDEALEQAHVSAPSVRAMALLHIARVLTAVDRAEARRTLDHALAEIDGLPDTEREPAMNDIVSLIATVSPEQAFLRLPSLERGWRQVDWMLRNMLEHGHKAEVIAYLADPLPGESYPSMAMLETLGDCRQDPEAQRAILSGGMRAMATAAEGDSPAFAPDRSEFVRAFVLYWKVLPREEAAQFLHEYVNRVLSEPDDRSDYKISLPAGTVRFSSRRQRELFEILGPLRELDAVLTESLIRDHQQLAKAALLCPQGLEESISAEAGAVAPSLPSGPIDWDDVNYGWIPVSQWLETTYPKLFASALNLYAIDTAAANPNRAPREIWPSTQAFRALLYRVGRHEGRAAPQASYNGVTLNPARLTVTVNDDCVGLSRREFAVLAALMDRPGTILSKSDLEAKLYGWQEEVESNTVEVHVHKLRTKIGRAKIETLRGIGYRMRPVAS